jgi:hypothetical protein
MLTVCHHAKFQTARHNNSLIIAITPEAKGGHLAAATLCQIFCVFANSQKCYLYQLGSRFSNFREFLWWEFVLIFRENLISFKIGYKH